jgi:transposase
MRKSFDTLAAVVQGEIGEDPLSGHLFVFCNRRRDRLKILYWDRSGYCLFAKRLEKGTFFWPASTKTSAKVEMTSAELSMLIGGIDLRSARKRRWIDHRASESPRRRA